MEDRLYHIRISPEFIKNKIFEVFYDAGTLEPIVIDNECCEITTTTTTTRITGSTYVYSSMTQILSGGTGGTSLLTGLTIPIVLTQNCVDVGYYSVFDGFALQKDVMTNFIFSANTGSSNTTYYFYNTSDSEFKKYLSFSSYELDWGDGVKQTISKNAPQFYSHTYTPPPPGTQKSYTISLQGKSPWGWNIVKKTIYVPFTGTTINNPNGESFFYPLGGNWSATPISYDYIFTADSYCDYIINTTGNSTTSPMLITGYTESSMNDLQVYGSKTKLFAGKFIIGLPITGDSGSIGIFKGPSVDGSYTAYTIDNIDYYDYPNGTTLFVLDASKFPNDDIVCSAITKDELLLNVIDQPEIQSDVYVERGKISGLESLQRIGEVDNIGDLSKYGYRFFRIINT